MSYLIENGVNGGLSLSYNQPLVKPKRVRVKPLIETIEVDKVLDLIDSITIQINDIVEVGEVFEIAKELELSVTDFAFTKMYGVLNENYYSYAQQFAFKARWNNLKTSKFSDLMFIHDKDLLIATVWITKGGVVSIKLDGLKQYANDRSLKRRELLMRVLSRYHKSAGIITRLHLTLDLYGIKIDKELMRFKDGVIYTKSEWNGLHKPMTRFERTINNASFHFKNGHELLSKIVKSYHKYFSL